MSDEEKRHPPRALGDNPFAGMDTLEWLGIEAPPMPETPAPEPVTAGPLEPDTLPALHLPDDEAERALQEWLREETPPESPPDAIPAPDAQAQLLARLLAEQEKNRDV